MDAGNDPQIEEVTFVKCTQIFGTEFLLNTIGYYIHQDPSPILIVNPSLVMAQTFSIDRLSPMIRDTYVLRDLVKDQEATKKSGNTILHKSFLGGHLTMAGANSPSSLASRPIRILMFDETDLYKNTKQGDPMGLARARTSEFWNRKIFNVSSPLDEGTSRIQKRYEASDQRKYWVPCPRCGAYQILEWSQVKWEKEPTQEYPVKVWYECKHCEAHLTERHKGKMIRYGEWRKGNPSVTNHAGFHINALYSQSKAWTVIVHEFWEAKSDPSTLKVWVNTILGEVWKEQESVIKVDKLALRRESYKGVPMGAFFLTAGVDVQDDRLECVVKGWGLSEESWFIEKKIFAGSPGSGSVWQFLYDYLTQAFDHESGVKLWIQGTCIDSSGHFTDATYRFCKAHADRRIIAIKGAGGYGKLFIGNQTRNNKHRALLQMLGVDAAKELIYDRLTIEEPGPGYMHFNADCTDEYFKQLTVEKPKIVYTKGFPARVWSKKDGARNEALDCEVYALAALKLCNANLKAIHKRLEAEIDRLEKDKKKTATEKQEEKRASTTTTVVKRKNWVNNF